jgi:superoxide reductase
MQLQAENTVDAAREKHVPVMEKVFGGVRVKVGSVAHPMEAKHWIEWIEVIADGRICRQFLEPGQRPAAVFAVSPETVIAREYCNLHGLWKW